VGSTNNVAREWLREGAESGAVVIADEQVQGRGRGDHGWYTPPGAALAMSVILYPSANVLPRLTMLGALSIAELCDDIGLPDVSIKWPNDVLVNGRKVSGILVEAEWQGDQLLGAVLGMGLNVRVNFAGTEVEDKAISLETALGKPLDRTELVALLLGKVDGWYSQLSSPGLFTAWKNRLGTLGSRVQIGDVSGIAEDVDDQGVLLIRDDHNHLHRVIAGDLRMTI
jgi:BirA family biotin operon repressor/biotin-[acetyl-CoA-carboxylase] ligase